VTDKFQSDSTPARARPSPGGVATPGGGATPDMSLPLREAIASLPGAAFVTDLDGKVVAWNRDMEKLTGVRERDIIGKGRFACGKALTGRAEPTLVDLLGSDDDELRRRVEAIYEYVAIQPGRVDAELHIPASSGQAEQYLRMAACPLSGRGGEVVGAVQIVCDRTGRRVAERQAMQAERDERSFARNLEALGEVSVELSGARSITQLCRLAVELGRTKLGFDRLGLWLATGQPNEFRGTFGTDEAGMIRDERAATVRISPDDLLAQVAKAPLTVGLSEDSELYNHLAEVVGRGMHAAAVLRSGRNVIGLLATDNLLGGKPITAQQTKLLRLYALNLAQLYTRKQAEESLYDEMVFANALLETAQVIVLVLDRDCRIVRMNPYAEELTGYSLDEVKGKDWISTFVPRSERTRIRRIFAASVDNIQTNGNVNAIVTRDGTRRDVEWYDKTIKDHDGNNVGVLAIGLDVTVRRKFEQERRQSQKMEAVGRLAGGIAHDFNNQLTIIKGYSDLILKGLDEGDCLYEQVQEIRKAAENAASVTSQLLTFSRKQMLHPRTLNINDVLMDMSNSLERIIGERIKFRIITAPDLGNTSADPSWVRQAIMNLVVNALDAMPNGGELTIRTRNVKLGRSYSRRHRGAKPGPHVVVLFRDTGDGMDAATRRRAFEPFFTTKPAGEGTGLGLSMVYGFTMQSGGNITLTSRPGKGTTLRIYLPSVSVPVGAETDGGEDERDFSGTETVLLVEDDQSIRELTARFLRDNGYTVLALPDAAEALDLAADRLASIDILVTDVSMPGMTGTALAAALREVRPSLPVLFTTGYAERNVLGRAVKPGAEKLLLKPFRPGELGSAIRTLLDAASSDGG